MTRGLATLAALVAACAAPYSVAGQELAPPFEAPLLSLVLPGAGQHVLGQDRKWAYLALEVVGWAVYFERRAAGADYRERYRDYAWNVARLQGMARIDGDFAYYETLRKWERSGAFDSDGSTAGVQPESDADTYNGSIWSLATGIFLPGGTAVPPTDPAYLAALAYYGERAYGASMSWSWPTTGQQSEYGSLIDASDARFRHATTALGVVIANHLLSAADAYLSSRAPRGVPRLRVVPAGLREPHSWLAVFSVGLGR